MKGAQWGKLDHHHQRVGWIDEDDDENHYGNQHNVTDADNDDDENHVGD